MTNPDIDRELGEISQSLKGIWKNIEEIKRMMAKQGTRLNALETAEEIRKYSRKEQYKSVALLIAFVGAVVACVKTFLMGE